MRKQIVRRPNSNRPTGPAASTRPADERPASLTDEIANEIWADEGSPQHERSDEEGGA